MYKVGFHILKAWAKLNAALPFWLLYLKSDVFYFVVYHVACYRRKVVRHNLLRSFPDKHSDEIKAIEKRFYRNLCDQFVEAPKMMKMGPEGYRKRITFTNPELAQKLYQQQKNIFFAIPHSGNWEWFGKLIPSFSPHKGLAIYKKVQNQAFERLMLEMRTADCPLEMVESNFALKRLAQLRNELNAVLMMADQSPRGVDSDYWTEFLHQDTCWFTGLERIAKMLDYAVVFVDMRRQDRGRYVVSFELITDDPKAMGKGEVMERYVRCVERFINDNPDNWLWSHRRWKHQRSQAE